jgi:uncharacterized protein (DUF2267 family)
MSVQRGLLIGVTALVVAGAAFGAVRYASAQEAAPTPATDAGTSDGGKFLSRVATNLGISEDQLRQAIKDAASEAVDEALASGRITQEQADRAKERIANGQGIGLRKRIADLMHRRAGLAQRVRHGVVESAAHAIGITPDALRGEIKSGSSIADVASENGVAVDAVKAQISADAQAKLSEAVDNGRITQGHADQALQKLSDRLDEALNKHVGGGTQ